MITFLLLVSFVKNVIKTKKPIVSSIILSSLAVSAIAGIIVPQIVDAVELKVPMSVVSSFSVVKNGKLTVCKIDPSDYEVVKKVKMTITAYTSRPEETDDTPFITASNTQVRDGILANNMLPFGTKVRIPELYGDKIFTVEDRMNRRMGNYRADIWMADYSEAVNFGAKTVDIEIIES